MSLDNLYCFSWTWDAEYWTYIN